MTRIAFQTDMRAAAVSFLEDYAASTEPPIRLQVYPGRPASINPPSAFVDRMSESISYSGPTFHQRTPRVDVVVLHGIYDHKETVNQRDAFMDGFLSWAVDRYHEAGANTLIAVVGYEDDPTYVPEWIVPREAQRTYFATTITLEGLALSG